MLAKALKKRWSSCLNSSSNVAPLAVVMVDNDEDEDEDEDEDGDGFGVIFIVSNILSSTTTINGNKLIREQSFLDPRNQNQN